MKKTIKLEEKDLVAITVFLNNVDFHARTCQYEESETNDYWIKGICGKTIVDRYTIYQIDRILKELEKALLERR